MEWCSKRSTKERKGCIHPPLVDINPGYINFYYHQRPSSAPACHRQVNKETCSLIARLTIIAPTTKSQECLPLKCVPWSRRSAGVPWSRKSEGVASDSMSGSDETRTKNSPTSWISSVYTMTRGNHIGIVAIRCDMDIIYFMTELDTSTRS